MPSVVTKKRCAVYTRVSDDEGLDQDYNSLQAQRDAGLAYIASQRHEGWIALDDSYNDGGYSGGWLERPALKRLLADIRAGAIDVVVVYKIDRLTRSLRDFFELMDVFEQHGVSFVSVTQQFNTSTAMGRLMLNVLLSFAQFEREQGAERIRDKIAASKAKGMWMGGVPPLGYDVKLRQLWVNEDEAKTVRHIFQRFLELRSITELARELNNQGVTTKSWVTQQGKQRQGGPIDKQFLYKLLRNPVYIGKVRHKRVGGIYDGQHEPIIDHTRWTQVQRALDEGAEKSPQTRSPRRPSNALLRGLLYGPDGERLVPTYTTKANGKRYAYYYPAQAKKFGGAMQGMGAIPASEIESVVLAQVRDVLNSPAVLQATCSELAAGEPQIDEAQVLIALRQFGAVWQQLFPEEQHRIVQLLVRRVQVSEAGVQIQWHEHGWRQLAGELAPGSLGAELRELELEAV